MTRRIFALAVALVACAGMASAQDHVVIVNHSDGTYTQFDADNVESVTYALSPWNKIATGKYRFADMYFSGGGGFTVTLWQHFEEPGQWELTNWLNGLGDNALQFTYDEETGEVYVPNQDTGYEGSTTVSGVSYSGDVFVCEASYMYNLLTGEDEESYGYHSHYDAESGTFQFAVGYYMWTGLNSIANFGYTGYPNWRDDAPSELFGYDTYEITDWNAAPSRGDMAGHTKGMVNSAGKLRVGGDAELVTVRNNAQKQ